MKQHFKKNNLIFNHPLNDSTLKVIPSTQSFRTFGLLQIAEL